MGSSRQAGPVQSVYNPDRPVNALKGTGGRVSWYREVHAKSVTSHEHRTILGARHQLVTMRSELDAQA